MVKYVFSKTWLYCFNGFITDLFHVYIRCILAKSMNYVATIFQYFGNKNKCAKYLMASNRYCYSSISIELFKKFQLLDKEVLFPEVSSGVGRNEAGRRSIIIRWPAYDDKNIVSKGILIITFTKVFSYYLRNVDINKLSKHFYIVLEPSWSGYFDADILSWGLETKDGVFVEATELFDRIVLNALTNNLIPLSFGASDWVDYNVFNQEHIDKQYDSIYVANTKNTKRVIRYIKAIKNISNNSDADYKGCLVCASWGGNEEIIKSLPKYFGIERNIEILFSLKKEELNKVINASKVNILLSYKEGSNRSLFESMFANTPAICIAENIGLNKSYINEYTGLLIPDRLLEGGLLYMKDNWRKFQPKKWAFDNISPEKTTEKLLALLEARGDLGDSNEIYIKTNNPEVSYLNYPYVEFSDINNRVLSAFEKDLYQNTDSVYNESKIIINCHQNFLRRISGKERCPPPVGQ